MAELLFIASEKNTFNVSENGIKVEFNAGNPAEFKSMVLGLGQTIRSLHLGCERQVSEFLNALPTNDELWTEDGRWAGMPFEKRYQL